MYNSLDCFFDGVLQDQSSQRVVECEWIDPHFTGHSVEGRLHQNDVASQSRIVRRLD